MKNSICREIFLSHCKLAGLQTTILPFAENGELEVLEEDSFIFIGWKQVNEQPHDHLIIKFFSLQLLSSPTPVVYIHNSVRVAGNQDNLGSYQEKVS